jgi:hypothetical protein
MEEKQKQKICEELANAYIKFLNNLSDEQLDIYARKIVKYEERGDSNEN